MRLGVRSCALGVLFLFMCYVWLACECGVGFQCTLTSVMYCMCMDLCVRVNVSHVFDMRLLCIHGVWMTVYMYVKCTVHVC